MVGSGSVDSALLNSFTGYRTVVETAQHCNQICRQLGAPVTMVVWALVLYTVADVVMGLARGGSSATQPSFWTTTIVKSVADAFFYVIMVEVSRVVLLKRENNRLMRVAGASQRIRETMEVCREHIRSIALETVVRGCCITICMVYFLSSRSIIGNLAMMICSAVLIARVTGIQEYESIPGEITVRDGTQGFVYCEANEVTPLECIIRANWITPPSPERSGSGTEPKLNDCDESVQKIEPDPDWIDVAEQAPPDPCSTTIAYLNAPPSRYGYGVDYLVSASSAVTNWWSG